MFLKEIAKLNCVVVTADDQSVTFAEPVSGKLFHIAENHTGFTIYQAYGKVNDLILLPGFQHGRSFRTVINFVNRRVK